MKFSLFSRNKKGEVVIVYDIGSASVGAALVLLGKDEKPKILYSVRKNMTFQERLDFTRFTKSMTETVKQVSSDLQKNGLSHLKFTKFGTISPEKIYCTLASPWYASQTRIVRVKEEKPFLITKEKIKSLVEKEVKDFIDVAKNDKRIGGGQTKIIEQRVMQTKLNGYDTSEPFDKRAKALELSAIISVAQRDILNDITDAIHSVFLTPRIEFNSFSYVAFDSIRDIKPNANKFLFLDISGELTDVSLVRDGVILETGSFPMGKNSILRDVKMDISSSEGEALSLIQMYHKNTLEKVQREKMKKVFLQIEKKWISLFRDSLLKLSDTLSIPSTVFFTSDENMEDVFSDLIRKEEFGQFTMTDDVFSVGSVNTAFLTNFVKFSKNAERDPFLTLGALFADKVHNG
ncbi:hypothetical protein ACFLY0_02520 [Patescibacteria group bacterium]